MKMVVRRIIGKRCRQLELSQCFVLTDVDRFQAPPSGPEIEESLLLCPSRVVEGEQA